MRGEQVLDLFHQLVLFILRQDSDEALGQDAIDHALHRRWDGAPVMLWLDRLKGGRQSLRLVHRLPIAVSVLGSPILVLLVQVSERGYPSSLRLAIFQIPDQSQMTSAS